MALHFTLVGGAELSIHLDIDGLSELLKGIEGAIRAAKDNVRAGAPDSVPVAVSDGVPNALGKVTITFLNPPSPTTH